MQNNNKCIIYKYNKVLQLWELKHIKKRKFHAVQGLILKYNPGLGGSLKFLTGWDYFNLDQLGSIKFHASQGYLVIKIPPSLEL